MLRLPSQSSRLQSEMRSSLTSHLKVVLLHRILAPRHRHHRNALRASTTTAIAAEEGRNARRLGADAGDDEAQVAAPAQDLHAYNAQPGYLLRHRMQQSSNKTTSKAG
jgi:hypothetical protein